MKKIGLVLMTAAVILGAACAFAAAPEGEPIKIGYLATLTGDGSTWGQHERDSALLAIKELNDAGGVLGRPLELVCYDVRGRQEDAIQAARRLVHEDKVVAIGGTNYSGLNIATASVVNPGKVPQIGTAATNPAVTVDPNTGEVRPFSFRISYTDPYQGKVMADYFVNRLGVKKAAIIKDVGSDYSEGLTEFFNARFKELGGELTGEWGFRSGDVDFRAQLTEMKASGAEAVALPLLYKEMALIMKQAAELDWKPLYIGGDGFSPNMLEIAGDAMEGSYWVYSMDLNNPQLILLLSRFEKEYGRPATEPSNVVNAYDLIVWVAEAIKRAGSDDSVAIKDAMEDIKDLRLVHFNLTVDKETHNPLNKPAAMMIWKDQKFQFLEMWAPQESF